MTESRWAHGRLGRIRGAVDHGVDDGAVLGQRLGCPAGHERQLELMVHPRSRRLAMRSSATRWCAMRGSVACSVRFSLE